ncbi:ribosomal-protein-alanine N-acetyltransferase [Verticiella sediminum]|uniref:[Ribosomal protein bS18]-alanine N-acetyltransferase n=1 Tax=Verticiella sediminum TaxID=1247510 RepID=A0A556ABR5_9BURK|nr:ribosomal protein S18-alanine N-acetyltransferase [Verticiella sediminum]TSH90313.1 ribosomal-protein-alanine N-acetyltransferase [Verticiella sediminum]
MTLRYAKMRTADLDEVAAIEKTIYTHPWTRGNFADSLAAGNHAWVVREEGCLVGYCLVMDTPDDAHLLNISVADEAQHRGIGRGLLEWVAMQARAAGLPSVLLEVRVSNERARRMYERAGYERIGLRRGYYPAIDGREDAIVMRKSLAAPHDAVFAPEARRARG